jgi:hypothetical protein
MYTVYLYDKPVCDIDEKTLEIKGGENKEAMRLIVNQIIRGINHRAGGLMCANHITKEPKTLGYIINRSNKAGKRRLSKSEKEKIDKLRSEDVHEQKIANEVNINLNKLYRIYPRAFNSSKYKLKPLPSPTTIKRKRPLVK